MVVGADCSSSSVSASRHRTPVYVALFLEVRAGTKANENDPRNEKWPSARKPEGEQCRTYERDDRQ